MVASRKSHQGSAKVRYGLLSAAAVMAAAQIGLQSASGATYTWTSASNTTWSTANSGDWTGAYSAQLAGDDFLFNTVPGAGQNITMGQAATDFTAIDFNTSGWNISGVSADTLTAANGSTIYIYTGTSTLDVGMTSDSSNGLNISGGGTLVLGAQSTYTASTVVTASTVTLDFGQSGAPTTNILYKTTAGGLTLAGGTLNLKGTGTNSQTFTTLTLNAGSSAINETNGGTSVAAIFTTITRNAGSTLNVNLASGTQSSTNGVTTTTVTNMVGVLTTANANGIAYATVGQTDWASISAGSGTVNIVPLGTGYTGTYAANDTFATGTNATVTTADNPGANFTINTLRFNNNSSALTLTGANVVSTGGILVTKDVNSGAVTLSGGTTIAPGGGNELVILNYATGTGTFTLSAAIAGTNTNTLTIGGTGTTMLGVSISNVKQLSVGGVLDLAGTSQSVPILLGAGTITNSTGTATLTCSAEGANTFYGNLDDSGSGTLNLLVTGGTLTLAGTGSNMHGSITMSGGGAITISGTFTYADAAIGPNVTQINVSGAGAFTSSGYLTIPSTVTFNLGSAASNVGHFIANGGLTIAGTVQDYTPGGGDILNESGNQKSLILTGVNTYSGGTQIWNTGGNAASTIIQLNTSDGATSGPLGAVPANPTAGVGNISIRGLAGLWISGTNVTISSNRGISLGTEGAISGGYFFVSQNCTLTYDGAITNEDAGGDTLYVGTSASSSNLGTLIFGGASTYTGGTVLSDSITLLNMSDGTAGNPGVFGKVPSSATPGNIIINSNGGTSYNASLGVASSAPVNVTLNANRGIQINPLSNSTGAGYFDIPVAAGHTLTYGGTISGSQVPIASNMQFNGAGTTVLGGEIDYAGVIIVTNGTVSLNGTILGLNAYSWGVNTAPTTLGTVTVTSGVLDLGGPGGVTTSAFPLILNGGKLSNSNASAVILGGGGIAGITRSTGYAGYFSTAPSVSINNTGTGGSGATATALFGLDNSNGTNIIYTASGYTSAPTVAITGGGGNGATATVAFVNATTLTITITNPGIGYTSSPTFTFTGGGGTVSAASYNASDFVIGGIDITSAGSGYTSAPAVTVTTSSGSATFAAVLPTVSLTATSSIGGVGNITIPMGITSTGAFGLTKVDSNTVILTGANTYTGATTVSGGTLSLQAANALSATAITITSGNVTENINGAISGTSSLTVNGASVVEVLTNTNSYSGLTTVTSGTLQTAVATDAFGTNLTGIGIGATGVLALRGDSNASFNHGGTAYPISVAASGATINVDQASSAAPGTTLTLGTVAMNGAYTLNTSGADGVSLSLGAVTSSSAGTNAIVINNTIASPGLLTLASVAYTANTATETITIKGGGNTTVTGAISQNLTNAVALTVNDTGGTVTLSAVSAITGATTVSGGTLALGAGAAITTSAVTVQGGAFLTIASNLAGPTTRFTTLSLTSAGLTLTGTGGVNTGDTGNGAMTLAQGASTITVNPGSGNSSTLNLASLTTTAGGTVVFNGSNLGSTAVTANASRVIFANGLVAANFTGSATTSGTSIRIMPYAYVVDSGTSSTTLATYDATNGIRPLVAGTDNSSSTTTAGVNLLLTSTPGGTVTGIAVNSLSLNGGVTLTLSGTETDSSGAILSAGSANTITGTGATLTLAGIAGFIHTPANLEIDSIISGNNVMTITKDGAGTLTLTNAGNIFGTATAANTDLNITGGTVSFSAESATPGTSAQLGKIITTAAMTKSIILNGGTLQDTGANVTLATDRGIALGPTSGFGSGTIDVTGANILTYAGNFVTNGGTGSFIKTDTGTLMMTSAGAGTYTGTTTVNGGTLSIIQDLNLGAVPGAATPGSINLSGGALSANASFALSSNRGIALGTSAGGGTGTLDVQPTFTLTYAGIIADAAGGTNDSLTKTGSGMLTVGGVSTYTGSTAITGGTVQLTTGNNRLPVGTSVADGGTLDLGGVNQALAGLTGAGTVTNSTGSTTSVLTITGTSIFGGAIQNGVGAVALSKTTGGAFTLNGTSTYSGGTNITGGTVVAGSAGALGSGNVTVNGGTLELDPIVNIGGGNLNLTSGTLRIDLGSDPTAALVSTGTFTLGGGTTLDLGLGPANSSFYNSSYTILNFTGGGTVGAIAITNYDTTDWTASLSNAGLLSFAATAVPEPASLMLLGLGAAGLLARRRRR